MLTAGCWPFCSWASRVACRSVWLSNSWRLIGRNGNDKTVIRHFALVSLPYSLRFVWAPLMDHLPLPVMTRLFGCRRGWLRRGGFCSVPVGFKKIRLSILRPSDFFMCLKAKKDSLSGMTWLAGLPVRWPWCQRQSTNPETAAVNRSTSSSVL